MIVPQIISYSVYKLIDITATLPSFNHSNEQEIYTLMTELQSMIKFAGFMTLPSSNGLYVFTITSM